MDLEGPSGTLEKIRQLELKINELSKEIEMYVRSELLSHHYLTLYCPGWQPLCVSDLIQTDVPLIVKL